MTKKSKQEEINLFYLNDNEPKKENIEDLMKKKKAKEREKRIKENKQKQETTEFDFDTETVISMTNKNRIKQNEEREQKLSKQERIKTKKKRRMKKIATILGLMLVLGGVVAFALCSPMFNIKEIEVVDNNIVASDTIISLSEISLSQNLFSFISGQAEKKIEEYPYIETAKIDRILPNKIKIDIKERNPMFAVPVVGTFAYVSSQGYILEIVDNYKKLPVINGISTNEESIEVNKRLDEKDLDSLEVILKVMNIAKEYELDSKVTSIDISNKEDYIINIQEEGKKVHLGDGSNINNKMLYIVAIIEAEKQKEGEIFANGDLNKNFRVYFRESIEPK